MGNIDKDIRELREKTGRTRYQFLRAELQTCFTALEVGKYQLSVGNATVAEREVAAVEKGIRAIQRFLPEVSAEQRREVETKLSELNEFKGHGGAIRVYSTPGHGTSFLLLL